MPAKEINKFWLVTHAVLLQFFFTCNIIFPTLASSGL